MSRSAFGRSTRGKNDREIIAIPSPYRNASVSMEFALMGKHVIGAVADVGSIRSHKWDPAGIRIILRDFCSTRFTRVYRAIFSGVIRTNEPVKWSINC